MAVAELPQQALTLDEALAGMRQPQWGGIQSRLHLARPNPLCASKNHDEQWRIDDEHPWVCATCHPPAFPDNTIQRRSTQ